MSRRPSSGDGQSTGDVLVSLLLAAFVIVVAAFVVTVTLDMGRTSSDDGPASVSVEFDDAADAIEVTFTAMARPNTELAVTVRNTSDGDEVGSARLSSVGASYRFEGLSNGTRYEVVVVAEWGDRQSLVTTRTGDL